MATRRKNSGFTAPKEEETASVEEFLEDSVKEIFEDLPEVVEELEEKSKVVETPPFVPMEIVPTEDAGPRFVEEPVTPVATPTPTPQLQPPPKRHPRNIPKFSRYK